MIEIVTPCNRQFYEDALDAMFRMRHRVFVEDKGWTLSSAGDGLERDAFDTAETVYFIWRGPNGAVHACARLNPTTGPHLLSGPFAAYCDLAPPPAGPDVHELSRFAVDRAAVGHERRREVRGRLDWAIACWCRRSRVGHVISFPTTEAYVARLRLWRTRPLGLPAPFDDGRTYIPAVSTVDEGLLTRLSAWYDFSEAMPACIRLCGGGLAEVYPDAAAAEA